MVDAADAGSRRSRRRRRWSGSGVGGRDAGRRGSGVGRRRLNDASFYRRCVAGERGSMGAAMSVRFEDAIYSVGAVVIGVDVADDAFGRDGVGASGRTIFGVVVIVVVVRWSSGCRRSVGRRGAIGWLG